MGAKQEGTGGTARIVPRRVGRCEKKSGSGQEGNFEKTSVLAQLPRTRLTGFRGRHRHNDVNDPCPCDRAVGGAGNRAVIGVGMVIAENVQVPGTGVAVGVEEVARVDRISGATASGIGGVPNRQCLHNRALAAN
jgi:hypothetical protein